VEAAKKARELRARDQHAGRPASDSGAHCIQSALSQKPGYGAPGHSQRFGCLRNRSERREHGDDVSNPIGFERLGVSHVLRARTRFNGVSVAFERFGGCPERRSDGSREIGARHTSFGTVAKNLTRATNFLEQAIAEAEAAVKRKAARTGNPTDGG